MSVLCRMAAHWKTDPDLISSELLGFSRRKALSKDRTGRRGKEDGDGAYRVTADTSYNDSIY